MNFNSWTCLVARGAAKGEGMERIDAAGLLVMSGGIDVHTHFEEPDPDLLEGFTSGGRSAAAGGLTGALIQQRIGSSWLLVIFGGLLLFLIALEMVFARESGTRTSTDEKMESRKRADISGACSSRSGHAVVKSERAWREPPGCACSSRASVQFERSAVFPKPEGPVTRA